MKKVLLITLSLLLLTALFSPAGIAQAATTNYVVTPLSTDWGFIDDNENGGGVTGFENGPVTAPLGNGSFFIELNAANAGYIMATQKYQGGKACRYHRLELFHLHQSLPCCDDISDQL